MGQSHRLHRRQRLFLLVLTGRGYAADHDDGSFDDPARGAAVFEVGGAWLVWQGWREHRGLWWIAAGVLALGAYGFVATFEPDPHFGRILAAYGGVFVAGSLAWGMIVDRFRPDRYDIIGAAICLLGVAIIMYAPRGHA